MKSSRSLSWSLWSCFLALFLAVVLFPVSNRYTRIASLVLVALIGITTIALAWRRPLARYPLIGITALAALFLGLPGRSATDGDALRSDYIAGLKRYHDVKYFWGGESYTGIDCSGLIRRGLVDAMFLRGLTTFDPALARRSLNMWWHDTTAKRLGERENGLTTFIAEADSLNALDHSLLKAGDLAVTKSGLHIMAYLGGNEWIEADPEVGKVIRVTVPCKDNNWFHVPMRIVRWNALQP